MAKWLEYFLLNLLPHAWLGLLTLEKRKYIKMPQMENFYIEVYYSEYLK